jgi:DGQHR domain-containing protein
MSRIVIEPVPSTPHFNFLHGSFGVGAWRVPYFAATVSFADAAQHLHLPSEIPGGEQIKWDLDALYQRNIDWQRVTRQIAPYLRATDMPQFFNAVTVALLPYSQSERRVLDSFAPSGTWNPPPLLGSYTKELSVGPVRFGFWDDWETPQDQGFETGQMRWNTDELFAVAIDGQHRLAAIKEIVDPGLATDANSSRLAVLFLIFDERVGFIAPDKPQTVELLRKLFIDLNKHAKTVNRARQILLDDRDPMAMSVRALLAMTQEDNLDDLQKSPPRLPLALVDWFTEQAKFDTGPYLTTVLGLDWIVSKALDTAPISDFTAYGNVLRQFAKLEARLAIYLRAARSRLQELQNVELTPFAYSDDDLDQIRDAFAAVWNKPLCCLFSEFAPYSELINQRIGGETLTLDWQEWYRLREAMKNDRFAEKPTQDYKHFLRALTTREHPVGERTLEERLEVLESLKRDYGLAFNVVFQRALVMGGLEYLKLSGDQIAQLEDEYGGEEEEPDFDVDVEEEEEEEEGEFAIREPEASDQGAIEGTQAWDAQRELAARYDTRMNEFIRNMNLLLSVYPDFLRQDAMIGRAEDAGSHYLWAGSLRKPEGGIDFTMSASNRASDWIFLAATMVTLRRSSGSTLDFSALWVDLQDVVPTSSTFIRRMRMAVKHLMTNDASVAGRIINARLGTSGTSRERMQEVEIRLRMLWEKIAESGDAT